MTGPVTLDAASVEAVAGVLAMHERSGVTGITEGVGDEEHYVGARAWCYCGPGYAEAQWRGTFNIPLGSADAELRTHVAAAIVAALTEAADQ